MVLTGWLGSVHGAGGVEALHLHHPLEPVVQADTAPVPQPGVEAAVPIVQIET